MDIANLLAVLPMKYLTKFKIRQKVRPATLLKNIFENIWNVTIFWKTERHIFSRIFFYVFHLKEFLRLLLILLLHWRKSSLVINFMSWSYLAKEIRFKFISISFQIDSKLILNPLQIYLRSSKWYKIPIWTIISWKAYKTAN